MSGVCIIHGSLLLSEQQQQQQKIGDLFKYVRDMLRLAVLNDYCGALILLIIRHHYVMAKGGAENTISRLPV